MMAAARWLNARKLRSSTCCAAGVAIGFQTPVTGPLYSEAMKSNEHNPDLHQAAAAMDQLAHAALARMNVGLSPVSLARAWTVWALNLAVSPGTQARLGTEAQTLGLAWFKESLRATPP